eukprot:Em0003g78a
MCGKIKVLQPYLLPYSYSLFEPNSRTLAEYGVSLEKAILRDSELLSDVNNAFCNSHPLLAQKVVTRSARAAVSKISADALLAKAISVRRSQAGSLLKTIRKVNAKKLQESDILVGHRFHTAGAEPYFFDNSYTHRKQHGAIPVDLNGRCVVAEEIKDRDKVTMRPLKWKCTNECRKLTSEEVAIVLKTNSLFQKSIEDLRAGLDALDSGCGHVHYDVTLKSHSGFIDQLGHPIYCELPECSSPLRVIRAAMPHYPALRTFTRLLYKARKCHMTILAIDSALASGNIDELIPFMGMKDNLSDLFSEDGVEHAVVSEDHLSSGLGCIERDLKVTHADLIAELQSKFNDDAEFACCSCERLFQRKQVSCVNFSLDKYETDTWQRLKAHVLQNGVTEQLYICQYCRPFLNKNTIPARCVLNGLVTELIPDELKSLNALSKQLIQRAKAFQTIVRLGTYSGKVPAYNALQACRGCMFFLPLPLNKTWDTLSEIELGGSGLVALPDPQLYIIVNGVPTKDKIVWQTLVDVNAVKLAIQKLKEINWLYKNVDDASLDEAAKNIVEVVDQASSIMLEKASTDDVAALQAYTIRSLDQQGSTKLDVEQYKMQNVKDSPIESRQRHLDVMCFPTLFPSGQFGEFHPRDIHLSASEYAKSRLLNKDSRFRKDPQYVFFLLWQQEMRQISAGIYNVLKTTSKGKVPVREFLSRVSNSDESVEANLSTIFQSVRGTKQYWFHKSSELKCMLREYGSPTLFITFSCAEYNSTHIDRYLRKVNDHPPSYPISKLCIEDPVSVSRKFSANFHHLFYTILLKGSVLGVVLHFFWKKEYQARGAPHYHVLLWIQDAPVIGKSDPKDVLAWIQERITCKIPDVALNPELHALVTKYQMHKCTNYCKRRQKLKSGFITKCRFSFPRDVTEHAVLNPVEECLKSRKKIYLLPRAAQECRVNDYNPLLLLLWQANMDIQFTAESSLTLAHYVTGYVTKAEKSNMQEVWQEVNSNSSIYSKLWSFGVRSLRSRECGLYEASDLLLGDHLTEKSVTVKWVDASMPHKRKRRLKTHKQLVEVEKMNPASTDILEGSMVDIFYPTRPNELENVCLYDFVQWYKYCGTDKDGSRVYQKLQKPLLPNHKLFDPSNENQREDYFYSLMLLFIPFRNECDLMKDGETAEVAFNRLIGSNVSLSDHHEKLQALLKAQTAVKKINEAREEEGVVVPPAEEDAYFGGEAKAAMEDVFNLNEVNAAETVEERVAKLNADQLRIFNDINDHLCHQKLHENGKCSCTKLKPLCKFISGVGGTGKSFLIHTIRAKVNELWKDNKDSIRCALAAPTGLAAFNIEGVTVHRLFQLPIEHDSRTSTYWSLPKESLKVMRNGFTHVKLIIIDEVSMLSSLTLAYIHLRLDELFGSDQWFGSMNVLFFGDLLQLPPVNGSMVFQNISNKLIAARLGCVTAVNIWRESIVYDELTINERQKRDPEFGQLLNEVRVNCISDKTVALLHNAVIKCTAFEKFQELLGQNLSPVCLFATRKSCDQFNAEMLSKASSPIVNMPCIDEFDETAGKVKWTKRASSELEKLNKDCNMTAGLEAELKLAVGVRVMLRRNIKTSEGLVNGALGTVTAISKNCIHVAFDHTPKLQFKIERVRSKFQVLRRFYVYRKQFPLILAFAVTIHKCQGLSLDCAIVDLSSDIFATGMAYVAMSRVRTLAGLHLLAFDPKSIKVSMECTEEVNRLRKLFRSDIPCIELSAVPNPIKSKPKRTGRACDILPPQPLPSKDQDKSTVSDSLKSKTSQRGKGQTPKQSTPKSSVIDLTVNDVRVERAERETTWPYLRYYQTDELWQRQKCTQLGLTFHSANNFDIGGPNIVLNRPNTETILRARGDGNCLFRCLSQIITGSPDQHYAVRMCIITHMRHISHLLIGSYEFDGGDDIEAYIANRKMDRNGSYGTNNEMLTLSHLLMCNVYSFNAQASNWSYVANPGHIDPNIPVIVERKSMYIYYRNGNHFDIVTSQLP